MSDEKQKQWLALPAVTYSTVEVIELRNKKGDKKLFRAQFWECCVRLTSIETNRPSEAVLVRADGPMARALGSAFDAFGAALGHDTGKTAFLLSASPNLLEWLGPFPEPEVPGADIA
ncbi:MAG: hypothetical protein WBK26_11760 [Burkholderiaceae bacterium]